MTARARSRVGDPVTAARAQTPRLAEQQLMALWRGRRFPEGALVTRAGVPVRVIFQGRPGRGPGPDFRGAVICGPSGLPVRGDVELHVRASSFRAHGHERDPAYANVILHVVFEDDTGADTSLLGGGTAPVVALAPWVARRAQELQQWLVRPLLWREPCHDSVLRLGASGVENVLQEEGQRRLAARAARLAQAAAASGIEQAIYEALLEALGFGGNAQPMLVLARLMRWDELRAEPSLLGREALLLGRAGLLPSQRGHRGPLEPHVEALERRFARATVKALPWQIWKLWGVRPANAPARRIAAAAALLTALGEPAALFACLDARTLREALAPLTSLRAGGYWASHYDACAGPARMPASYIGRARAIEITLNVVLPAAIATGDPALHAKALLLAQRLPRPAAYGITRYLEESLTSEGIRINVNALRSQGLLALHRDWCTQGGCGRCPLS
jgi:hypothetical protein